MARSRINLDSPEGDRGAPEHDRPAALLARRRDRLRLHGGDSTRSRSARSRCARPGRRSPARSTGPTRSSRTRSRWHRCPPTTATRASIRGGWGLGIPKNLPQEDKDCAWHILTQITSEDFEKYQVLNYQTDPNRIVDRRRTRRSSRHCRTSPRRSPRIESAQILEFANLPQTFEIAGDDRARDQPRADRARRTPPPPWPTPRRPSTASSCARATRRRAASAHRGRPRDGVDQSDRMTWR